MLIKNIKTKAASIRYIEEIKKDINNKKAFLIILPVPEVAINIADDHIKNTDGFRDL